MGDFAIDTRPAMSLSLVNFQQQISELVRFFYINPLDGCDFIHVHSLYSQDRRTERSTVRIELLSILH